MSSVKVTFTYTFILLSHVLSIVIQRIMLYYVILLCFLKFVFAEYEPTWESLDSRPLPEWFDKSKVGIFVHWGVYSVPSFRSEWFWLSWQGEEPNADVLTFMEKNYPPTFTYEDFAPQFTTEFFNAEEWADLLKKSGAKYVVLTSKHHEGYTLWPSKYSWNSADVGPKRDIVGELSSAIRSKDMIFGVYYSLYEWFHPLYKEDKANNWATTNFVDMKIIPEMHELINNYKPDVLWSDGDWEATDTYWKSKEFLTWLYNESPVKDTVVTNDRWGPELGCKHGGFLTCADRYNPERKWENAMTIDKRSWGYRRNANIDDIFTIHELITTLTQTVSCGGNILINIGPTKEGTIVPIFQERLIQLGTWLQINGDAIYETVPWSVQDDILAPSVWYTSKSNFVYAIVLDWPSNSVLSIGGSPGGSDIVNITLLGNENTELQWKQNSNQTDITFPDKASVASEWAWVIKFSLRS